MDEVTQIEAVSSAEETAETVLSLQGLSKAYGKTQALNSIDLRLRPHAVHGLVGENGAGKSTLVKILSGTAIPDAGTITIDGRPVDLSSPAKARSLGISTVFQELTLIPDLSVARTCCCRAKARGCGRAGSERDAGLRRRSDGVSRRWT